MKYLLLVGCLFIGTANVSTYAQNCETTKAIPSGHNKLGSGSATADYEGTTEVKGGQSVYVKIKNENAVGVSYILTVEENAKQEHPNCTYKAVLLPQASVILYGALLAEPPINWKVTVAVGSESDAGVLTYEVYSTTK